MAQGDRDVLFANESFVIGMLQAVSGGSLVATLAQAGPLAKLAGRVPFGLLLTAMALALVSAVLAAYWKHQYKMWDVKGRVSAGQGNAAEAKTRSDLAGWYLNAMRRAMLVSVVLIVAGLLQLVLGFWTHAPNA